MTRVILTSTKTNDPSDVEVGNALVRAVDLLNFDFRPAIRNVVIKPNLCYYWDYSTGETTDPRVISALIDYLRKRLGRGIDIVVAEADATAMKTRYCFKVLGYERLCETKGVRLANLSQGDIVDTKVTVGDMEFHLPINNILLKSDLTVNVPKLRTHNAAQITCALKNMFGAIAKPRKYVYHSMLSQAIVGANKIAKSHLNIVDGIIARGKHPLKLGVLLVGDDPLATDFVAARTMGFDPKRVEHLRLAEKEGIGNVRNVELVEDGVKLSDVRNRFPRQNYRVHRLSWNLQLKTLRLYAAITGDVIPPVLEQQ